MVVVRVPDHLTGDGGAHGRQLHVVRHGGDLGKADCIRHAIGEEEMAQARRAYFDLLEFSDRIAAGLAFLSL